jgi:hypothetical protein
MRGIERMRKIRTQAARPVSEHKAKVLTANVPAGVKLHRSGCATCQRNRPCREAEAKWGVRYR